MGRQEGIAVYGKFKYVLHDPVPADIKFLPKGSVGPHSIGPDLCVQSMMHIFCVRSAVLVKLK